MPTDILKQFYPRMGQGPAKLISNGNTVIDATAKAKDDVGFTHPNLHRRIYTPPDGSMNHNYEFSIQGVNSYRMTEIAAHDEESTTSEVP